jgi:hypothetical protein
VRSHQRPASTGRRRLANGGGWSARRGVCLELKRSQDFHWSTRGGLYILHAAAFVDPRRCTYVHTRTLPIVVAVSWGARVPASGLGQSRKLAVFWAAGGSTRGSTLVRVRVRTYAARELRFSELPTSSLRAGPQAPTNTTFGR